jgi:hypothetical protein
MLRLTFRNGIYVGLVLAMIIGPYLWFLWQPRRQVQLHTEHFLEAIQQKSWGKLEEFVDERYQDQWSHNRELLLTRLREVLRFMRNLRLQRQELTIAAKEKRGQWLGRISVEADANEVSALVKERVNALETPFELHWQQQSGKPWDWKLVAVSNSGLELPVNAF